MNFYEHQPNGNWRSDSKKHSWLLKGFLLPFKCWCTLILHKKLSCHVMHGCMGLAHWLADGSENAISFASRTLSNAEKEDSQVEKEGLACVFGVRRFHAYLYGHSFTLIADHKALLALFNPQWGIPPQPSECIQRWDLAMAMYEYTIAYRSRATHGNADAMSRLPLPESPQVTRLPPEMILLMKEWNTTPITAERIRV